VIYKVEWAANALAEVASEFEASQDKVAIIEATYQIDRALETDPIYNGTPLSEGMFYIDRSPLRAIYSINDEFQRVDVGRIRRIL
jgi:hypothetical protein